MYRRGYVINQIERHLGVPCSEIEVLHGGFRGAELAGVLDGMLSRWKPRLWILVDVKDLDELIEIVQRSSPPEQVGPIIEAIQFIKLRLWYDRKRTRNVWPRSFRKLYRRICRTR